MTDTATIAETRELVERFEPVTLYDNEWTPYTLMSPSSKGDWVRYSDYESAITRLTASLAAEREAREIAEAKCERYEKRLEIDHHFIMGEGDELVRVVVPPELREGEIDGIEARDATIALQDERIERLEAEIARREQAVAEERAAEREACAKVAQTHFDLRHNAQARANGLNIAAAIRARSEEATDAR